MRPKNDDTGLIGKKALYLVFLQEHKFRHQAALQVGPLQMETKGHQTIPFLGFQLEARRTARGNVTPKLSENGQRAKSKAPVDRGGKPGLGLRRNTSADPGK